MGIDVSIIVPSYNNSEALTLTLIAFNCQTYPSNNYELIVVDDGSSDGTEALVNSFQASYRLRYIKQRNMGRSKARNHGIRIAMGEIIIFNDADGIPCPDFVAEHVKYHQSDECCVVIGGKYDLLARWEDGIPNRYLEKLLAVSGDYKDVRQNVSIAEQGQSTSFLSKVDIQGDFNRLRRYVFRKSHHNWDDVYEVYFNTLDGFVIPWILLVTINVSVSKTLLMKAGLFDESFIGWGLEDTELGYRLERCGAKFVYNEAAANYHQVHPNDVVKRWKEFARNYARFCEKHPMLEIYLHWRFTVGLMSAQYYNDLVKGFCQLSVFGYTEIAEDYLAVSKELAEVYGQDEICLSTYPRPIPDSLGVPD